MAEFLNQQVKKVVKAKRNYKRYLALLLCLSMLVGLGTVAALTQKGEALTHKKKVLDCSFTPATGEGYAGYVAHVHNDDCYDAKGQLLCTLPEIPAHYHTDACWETVKETVCGLEESAGHVHTEDCYARGEELVCGLAETEGHTHSDDCYAWYTDLTCGEVEYPEHWHGDDCYSWTTELICGLEEGEEHTHDENCYGPVRGELICGQTEGPGHAHDDSCYGPVRGELICGLAEVEPHTHTAACHPLTDELICGLEEGAGAHTHDESCWHEVKKAVCGFEGIHIHNESCYDAAGNLVCGQKQLEVHVHGEDCFKWVDMTPEEVAALGEEEQYDVNDEAYTWVPAGDPNAGVETWNDWNNMFLNLELSGNWSEDLLAVARTQLGYGESEANYALSSTGGVKGYTRYGAWYGIPYGDWCAMFASFCIRWAGIPEENMPVDCNCSHWINQLAQLGMYASAESYAPKPGDLVFYDFNDDGISDHVGIVAAADLNNDTLITIEGNRTDFVETFTLRYSDAGVMGYGLLPVNPDPDSEPVSLMPAQHFEDTVGDVTVTVEAPEGAFPADTRMELALVEDEETLAAAAAAVADDDVGETRAVSISFFQGEEEIEPKIPVHVTLSSAFVAEAIKTKIIHINPENQAVLVVDTEKDENGISFNSDVFSAYVMVEVYDTESLKKPDVTYFSVVTTEAAGEYSFTTENATLTLNVSEAAGIPVGTEIFVGEIPFGTDLYWEQFGTAWTELNKDRLEYDEQVENLTDADERPETVPGRNVDLALFFDIMFVNKGKEIEPLSAVGLNFELKEELDVQGSTYSDVVHFAEEGMEIIEGAEAKFAGGSVVGLSYSQDTFSGTGFFLSSAGGRRSAPHSITAKSTYGTLIIQYNDGSSTPALMEQTVTGVQSGSTVTVVANPFSGYSFTGLTITNLDGDYHTTADVNLGGTSATFTMPDFDVLVTATFQPPAPVAEKKLTPNGDGTYQLSLSVTGAESDVSAAANAGKKVNVIVVMDRSNSMNNNYVYVEYDGEYESGVTYYGLVGNNYRQLNYNTSTGRWTYTQGGRTNNYTGAIYKRMTRLVAEQEAMDGMVQALLENNTAKAPDTVEVKIISFASGRGDESNNDYYNTGTESAWSTSYETLMAAVNNDGHSQGTNWDEGLQYALDEANAIKTAQPAEDVYILFLTDGEPTTHEGDYTYSTDYVTELQYAEPYAKEIVDTGYNFYGVFTYGDGNRADYLRRLVNYAYGNGDISTATMQLANYFTDASSQEALLSAIEQFIAAVFNSLSYGGVSITDGVTMAGDSATPGSSGILNTTITDGEADGFVYTVSGSVGALYTVTATGDSDNPTVTFHINGVDYSGQPHEYEYTYKNAQGTEQTVRKTYYSAMVGDNEYKMALAEVDENGLVKWDLGGIGALKQGYTYNVEFTVWPNQGAYDTLTNLINGTVTWNEDTAEVVEGKGYSKGGVPEYPYIVKYSNGTYAALTNYEQEIEYFVVNTVKTNDQEVITYDGPHTAQMTAPEPVELASETATVKKIWDDSINPKNVTGHLSFRLLQDGAYYQTNGTTSQTLTGDEYVITVSDTDQVPWSGEVGISVGIVRFDSQGNADVVESGHEYTLEEFEIVCDGYNDFNFEYTSPIVRPMILTDSNHAAALCYLVRINSDYPAPAGAETYTIDGKNYYLSDAGTTGSILTGTNHKKSELDITKMITVGGEKVNSSMLDEETFTYRVTLTIPAGSDVSGLAIYEYVPRIQDNAYTLFGYQNDTTDSPAFDDDIARFSGKTFRSWNTTTKTLCEQYYNPTPEITYEGGAVKSAYTTQETTMTIDLTLKQTEVIRFGNVPHGTQYTIQEIYANKYTADSNKDADKVPSSDPSNLQASGYTVANVRSTDGSVTMNEDGTATVTGSVDARNARYYNLFYNDVAVSEELKIKKIGGGNTENLLGGVEFKLYSDEECTKQVLEDANGQAIGTDGVIVTASEGDAKGTATIGHLLPGTYYLKEIKTSDGYTLLVDPAVIIINADGTSTIQQSDYKGGQPQGPENGYLIVNNNTGNALPKTGGMGVAPFTVGGLAIALCALALLLEARRRQRRRGDVNP